MSTATATRRRSGDERAAFHLSCRALMSCSTQSRRVAAQLRSLAAFTGLTLESKSSVVLPADSSAAAEARRVRRVTLAGRSCDVTFSVIFDVLEPQLQLARLKIDLPGDVVDELGSALVERCAAFVVLRVDR